MRKSVWTWLVMLGLCFIAFACDDNDDGTSDGTANSYDFQPILKDSTEVVIIGTYKKLYDAAGGVGHRRHRH